MFQPEGIALDSKNNIYVANSGAGGVNGSSVLEALLFIPHGVMATWHRSPPSVATTPASLALRYRAGFRREHLCHEHRGPGCCGPGSVTVYPSGSNGNTTPSATITGTNTRTHWTVRYHDWPVQSLVLLHSRKKLNQIFVTQGSDTLSQCGGQVAPPPTSLRLQRLHGCLAAQRERRRSDAVSSLGPACPLPDGNSWFNINYSNILLYNFY